MHAVQLLGAIAGLAFIGAAYAQASLRGGPTPTTPPSSTERSDDDWRFPAKPKAQTPSSTYTAPPRYRERTEREYDQRPTERPSPPPRSSSTSTPRTQPVKTPAKPSEARDPALARCDDLRRRMEQLVREEGYGGDASRHQRLAEQKRSLYQEELRFGCI